MASLTPDDYTVAWVCALPLEAAAARVLLDKPHPPPQEISDQNAYDFGELNGHHIVIAYLPSGVYGKVSAAGVVSRMRSTFRHLQFALMVGIGGGVPGSGKNDIRLGDVVVSKPGPKHSGVIQYDYGKAIQGGAFEATGTTNKPPGMLLSHVSQLEARAMTAQDGSDDVQAIVQRVLEKSPHLQDRFGAPDADLLFSASYRHANGESCDNCDREQLVERHPRETRAPRIHYGLIASGDRVIKDSATRDRLAQEHGILCFEMEAAGLMDELPTLVIRGICDYCDSHKQKQWQGYAALTAAAWAKLLLSAVPAYRGSSRIKKEQRHWVVPLARNPRFVGRGDQIAQLEQSMTTQDGPRRVAITGLGGVGKTQIALEVAYRIRDRGKDCSVFWVPCTSQAMIDQAFLQIAQAVGLHCTEPAEVKQRLKAYLSSERAGRWLLIFDNADDAEMWLGSANEPDNGLEDSLPQSSQGRILFTTRNRKLAMKLAPFELVPIPDEDREIAFQILREMLGHDVVADETSAALLEQLAHLPLAITQASAYITENSLSLSTYLELFQEQEQDAVELLSEDFSDARRYKEIQNPVITTWLISFRQIQHQNPLAADYLSFMAIINPRNIPMSILPPGATRKQQLEAIGLLSAYSFTTSQPTGINMHRLVHMATRNWLRQNGLFDRWVGQVADRMDDAFPPNDNSNRQLWRQYLPHAFSLVQDEAFTSHEDCHPKLLQHIADCLYSDGRYSGAEALYARLVTVHGRGAGQDNELTLDSMAKLALMYCYQARWKECDELYFQVFDGQQRLLGAEHPKTIETLRMRAVSSVHQLRDDEAEELALQALQLCERGLGPDARMTLICHTDLARVYSMQGRRDRSLETNLSTMERMKIVLGPEDAQTLSVMSSVAMVYLDMGDYTESEKLINQLVEIHTRLVGPEHRETLWNMNTLARLYRCQARLDEAEALRTQIVSTQERVLGLEHPDTLDSMSLLPALYEVKGQYSKAAELGAWVLDLRQSVMGPEHPDTLGDMEDLAWMWRGQGKLPDALDLLEECSLLRNKIQGPDHLDSVRSSATLMEWKNPPACSLREAAKP
ncbi:hypothetical protein BJY00DRAFT_311079 [Aspergillus carlsbadensis]|nr:hypothetical protein BJY00DRAFT_311079 [Aspergillus carlsbadensis]